MNILNKKSPRVSIMSEKGSDAIVSYIQLDSGKVKQKILHDYRPVFKDIVIR